LLDFPHRVRAVLALALLLGPFDKREQLLGGGHRALHRSLDEHVVHQLDEVAQHLRLLVDPAVGARALNLLRFDRHHGPRLIGGAAGDQLHSRLIIQLSFVANALLVQLGLRGDLAAQLLENSLRTLAARL
jgi:hypothetical protein